MHLLVAVTGPEGPALAESLRAVLPEATVSYLSQFDELLTSAQTVAWDAAIITPDTLSGSFRAALRVLSPGITIVIAPRTGLDALESALADGADDLIVAENLAGVVPELLARLRLRLASRNREERVRDRYRQVVETPGHIAYRLDPEGRFTELAGDTDVLGGPASTLIGHHFSEVLDPHCALSVSRESVLPGLSGVSTGSTQAPGLFDERRRGRRRTTGLGITFRARPGYRRGAEGTVTSSGEIERRLDGSTVLLGSVGVIHSIRRGGRASDVAHTFYAVAEEAPAAVLVLSTDLVVEYANPGFYHRFLVQPEAVLGRHAGELLRYGVDSRVPEEAANAIETGRRWSGSALNVAPAGSAQYRVVVRAITDISGVSRGAVVIFSYMSPPLSGARQGAGAYTIEDLMHSVSGALEKTTGGRCAQLDITVPRHIGQLPTAGFEFLRSTITDLLGAALADADTSIETLSVAVDQGQAQLTAVIKGESIMRIGTGAKAGSPALLAVGEIARDQLDRIGGEVEISRAAEGLEVAITFPVGQAATDRVAARLSGSASREVYNLAAFLKAYEGNRSLAEEILDIFARETPDKLARLGSAMSGGKYDAARHLAQSLATTTGTLMHNVAAASARDLEFALRVGDGAASGAAFRRFEQMVEEILLAIRRYRSRVLSGDSALGADPVAGASRAAGQDQMPPGLLSGMDSGVPPDSANSADR